MGVPGTEILTSRESLLARLKEHTGASFMVYDLGVEAFAESLADEVGVEACLGVSVREKEMDTVTGICRFLLEGGADRESILVAVGGGTLTDIAGFAASIYKRGIRCAYVPTTVLSQADACIGGKTGVNLDGYKNIIGTFSAPSFVCILDEPLRTLPRREQLSGLAEILKTFLALDASLYEKCISLAAGWDLAGALALAPEAARLKAEVVSRDPFEKGERRILNLGHTFGHAIEWYEACEGVADPFLHGEAVSVGIILAAALSESEGIAKKGLAERLRSDFSSCGLPTECPCPVEALEEAIRRDKKNLGGEVRYVYIKDIGEAVWSV